MALLKRTDAAGDDPDPKYDARYIIGLDTTEDGTYTYISPPPGWMNDWAITIDGMHLEHVDNDAQGCWLYRKQH